jgi:hypothetical protein
MRITTNISVAVIFLAVVLAGLPAQKTACAQQEKTGTLIPFVEKHFPRWDHNHDGVLELEEVDREIENRSVHGREAAVIVQIRRHLTAKDNPPRLSRAELLALARERAFEKPV